MKASLAARLLLPAILILVSAAPTTQPRIMRVAVISGMNETGFWEALA
jgi:hypothetical protein